MTKVMVVDDHPLFIDGVRAALSSEPTLEVVAEAHPLAEARLIGPRAHP